MDDEVPQEEGAAGSPAWVMTFADLMSLLMCFFVLLLSFSEMDVQKFKQLAGSMEKAFGVQRDVRAHEIPKGTSVVKKEFSPGKPQPTVLNEVRQHTVDQSRRKLELAQSSVDNESTQKDAREIASSLQQEIQSGKVEVETQGKKIIIRILEKGSFESADDELNPEYMPVIKKMRDAIKKVRGKVRITGHTDDLAINSTQFRSNWELSTARAVSVLHALEKGGELPSSRFNIAGMADTQPLIENTDTQSRQKNRRVELTILQEDLPTVSQSMEKQASELVPIEGLTVR